MNDAHPDAGRRFLTAALVGALNTANAKRPLSTKGRSGLLCFFPSWLTSELPLHTIGWQSFATAMHVRRGALRSRQGWAGLAVTAASWWGLRSIWLEDRNASAVLDAALAPLDTDSTISNHVGQNPVGGSARRDAQRRRQVILGPANYPRRKWVHEGNINYGEFGRRNRLDIWRSPNLRPGDAAPVLLQVHGGGWVIGNKDQQGIPLMSRMAAKGWVCVAINYRLSPKGTWPDHIVDVKRALVWIKDHIHEYGGDPNFVAITGGSAGGHLCSLTALSANAPEFQPGFEARDTSVACAVPFYGVYDFTNRDGTGFAEMEGMLTKMVMKVPRSKDPELWDHASSMSWVSKDAPPFFVLHGTNDVLVPVAQARSFVRQLRDRSEREVFYAELPGAQHAFDVFASDRSLAAVDAVERFLNAMYARFRFSQVEVAEA